MALALKELGLSGPDCFLSGLAPCGKIAQILQGARVLGFFAILGRQVVAQCHAFSPCPLFLLVPPAGRTSCPLPLGSLGPEQMSGFCNRGGDA